MPAALAKVLDLLPARGFALITSLDSEPEVAELPSLRRWASSADVKPQHLGSAVVLTLDELRDLMKDINYFTGFDEVWIYDRPPTTAKPSTEPGRVSRRLRFEDDLSSGQENLQRCHEDGSTHGS